MYLARVGVLLVGAEYHVVDVGYLLEHGMYRGPVTLLVGEDC